MESEPVQTEDNNTNRLKNAASGASKTVIALSTTLSLLTGGLSAWAFAGFGGTTAPLIAFIIGGALSFKHLTGRSNGWTVTGRGLHISAAISFFLPFLFYVPQIIGSSQNETLEGSATFLGSLMGLIIWGVVFFFLAALFGLIGYLCNKKGTADSE